MQVKKVTLSGRRMNHADAGWNTTEGAWDHDSLKHRIERYITEGGFNSLTQDIDSLEQSWDEQDIDVTPELARARFTLIKDSDPSWKYTSLYAYDSLE